MVVKDNAEETTAEFMLAPAEPPFVHEPGSMMAVDLGAASHQGHVRRNNEDHYLIIRFRRSLEKLYTNLDERHLDPSYDLTGYGFLVADGLGGMSAGEVASRRALTKLVDLVVDTPDWIFGFKTQEQIDTILARMTERFLRIDEMLRADGEKDVTLSGMGTTLTVAGALGRDLVIGHVGDSRAYLLRNENLVQLTKDHTLAQALVDAGVAGTEDPAARSMRHVLTAALGSLGRQFQPDVRRVTLTEHDQLLLCTDGLTEMVDNKTITSILRNAETAEKACHDLITVALAAGGTDNITVVLARFNPPA
jgi:protein phosphatase